MKLIKTQFSYAALIAFITLIAATFAAAQAPAPVDYSKTEIKATKLSDNFYTLQSVPTLQRPGGTMGALVGPDGVLMIDNQFGPLSDKIVATVKTISNTPIRFMVNTHLHGDHTGGNENFGKMGVVLFARDEVRNRLAGPLANGPYGTNGKPYAAVALPMITYEGPVTFHMNGEEVELVPILRAHTDGDTLVRIKKGDIIMCGDFFRSSGYPNIALAEGGTLKGMLEGLNYLIGIAGPNTRIVPGHGEAVGKEDIIAHRDMIVAIRDRVAQMVAQGKTVDEVLAAHLTSEYDVRVPIAKETADRFVGQVYSELKPAK
jgi:glyoxylase-like metal-dependent hydrolase (beta-lactamase superfamily II)